MVSSSFQGDLGGVSIDFAIETAEGIEGVGGRYLDSWLLVIRIVATGTRQVV